ncbi:flavin-binding monooxygenase-like domain-containing protein [Hirsutella rhossiliensis]|uniref:Flavin-binding monooxygenase-like domain-containing protein n=1 Tax=Hirsutella rhossiliensis TaxID=111463 RepID=A0A9P8SH16_9HYPO|nr:flavin-binding monooxygenase-like domain-containing protein [Hirsutella rhossiliensis]KAH0961684.1 flavin-binding monooxygenase-like domain-containing protein [Hirsutella rhossiliensis]
MESLDCVVVGAGWYGLAAAKQYRCVRPDDSMVVLDSQSSLGGTWADERLYPGLKSNNLLGTYEYPDFPMDCDRFQIKNGEHIPGEVVNAYLKAYAVKFGIHECIRLRTRVTVAEHQLTAGGGWILTTVDIRGEERKVFARRLIIATGLTSEPFIPHMNGQETFGGRIFHGKDFLQNRDTLETAKAITIVGASKFSWDAVYSYAKAGVQVNWVIRSSGHGPCWMSPPYVTPFKKWIEKLANIRFLTWFSPCIWGDLDGYAGARRLLHRTAIGRFIVDSFWKVLGNDVLSLNAYDSHPETAKLKPWIEAMFTGTSFSILNYDEDFFDFVKSDQVNVHIGEVDRLSPGKVHLADGAALESDAVLAHTGWKQEENAPSKDLGNQTALLQRADEEIMMLFPRLQNQPEWTKNYTPLVSDEKSASVEKAAAPCNALTSYMLHHFIVPPSERFLRARDIVFAGMVGNFSNTLTAHLQGLWIVAYFSGVLENDPASALGDEASMEKLQYETVLHNRFGKWRYPADWGNKAPSFIFDAVPYLDLLQRDLGLDPHRKQGFLSEIWEPYGPEDYRHINSDWEKKYWAKMHNP